MEGHLVLASRGIMFYYILSHFMNIHPYLISTISFHEYPPLPNQWRIQGRGPGGGGAGSPLISLFFDQTEARRAEKSFFGDHPSPLPFIKGSG